MKAIEKALSGFLRIIDNGTMTGVYSKAVMS
jgi:hypothetical protein